MFFHQLEFLATTHPNIPASEGARDGMLAKSAQLVIINFLLLVGKICNVKELINEKYGLMWQILFIQFCHGGQFITFPD